MVLVVFFVALPPFSIGGRGASLKMVGVFDGPGGRVGGSRYHTRSPSVKSCRLQVSKADLLMILDGRNRKGKRKRKRKRIVLIGNEPQCFPSN